MRKYPESSRKSLKHLTLRSAKISKKQSPCILRACSSKLTFLHKETGQIIESFYQVPRIPGDALGKISARNQEHGAESNKLNELCPTKSEPTHIFLFYLYQLLINLWYYDHFVIRRRQSEELIFSDILYCRDAVRNDLLNVRETAFYWNW